MQAYRPKQFVIMALALALVVGQLPIVAAPARDARLSGRVFDKDLVSPAKSLTVQAIPDGSKAPVASTQTDAKGRFQLLDIPSGSYVLLLSDAAGQPLAAAKVAMAAGEKQEITLALPDRTPGQGSAAPGAAGGAAATGGFFTTAGGAVVIVVGSALVLSGVAHSVTKPNESNSEPVSPSSPAR